MDLRMSTLFCSSFKQVIIQKAVFKGVDVWYNKAARSSNINDVLSLNPGDPPGDRALFGGKAAAGSEKQPAQGGGGGAQKGGTKLTLREVRVAEAARRRAAQS